MRMVRQQGPTWPPTGWEAPPGVEEGMPIDEQAFVDEGVVGAPSTSMDWGRILLFGGLAVGGVFAVRALAGKKKAAPRRKASPAPAPAGA